MEETWFNACGGKLPPSVQGAASRRDGSCSGEVSPPKTFAQINIVRRRDKTCCVWVGPEATVNRIKLFWVRVRQRPEKDWINK
jgi:hypothetical protein